MKHRALYDKLMAEGKDRPITMTRFMELGREIAEATEHEWVRDEDGGLDFFAGDFEEYHNGPRCKKCGYEYCMHCKNPTFECE